MQRLRLHHGTADGPADLQGAHVSVHRHGRFSSAGCPPRTGGGGCVPGAAWPEEAAPHPRRRAVLGVRAHHSGPRLYRGLHNCGGVLGRGFPGCDATLGVWGGDVLWVVWRFGSGHRRDSVLYRCVHVRLRPEAAERAEQPAGEAEDEALPEDGGVIEQTEAWNTPVTLFLWQDSNFWLKWYEYSSSF